MLGSLSAGSGKLCLRLSRWCHHRPQHLWRQRQPFTSPPSNNLDVKQHASTSGRAEVQAQASAAAADAPPAAAKGRKVGKSEAQDGSAKGMIDTNPPKGTFCTCWLLTYRPPIALESDC